MPEFLPYEHFYTKLFVHQRNAVNIKKTIECVASCFLLQHQCKLTIHIRKNLTKSKIKFNTSPNATLNFSGA